MSGWFVPGRVEVLGKHTDYGGGRVLVCAVDRGITVRAEAIDGPAGRIEAATDAFDDPVRLTAGEAPDLAPGHWGLYVQTVIDRLTANFGPLPAARLAFSSDLPPASGMSSSSALLTGTALSLADLAGLTAQEAWRAEITDRLTLAGYAASIENGRSYSRLPGRPGVGTSGGSLDHTGMLATRDGAIACARFDPMRITGHLPFPAGWSLVVAVSGVLAEKTGAARDAYNRGPASLAATLQAWNADSGREDASLQAAMCALTGQDADAENALPEGDRRLDPLRAAAAPGYDRDRLEQFLIESGTLVPAAAAALAAEDIESFGGIVARSQELAVTHLGNQVPETIALVDHALALGATASSAFGAGFGGSVWALVPAPDADAFAADWLERYRRRADAPERAGAIVTRPSAAARPLPA